MPDVIERIERIAQRHQVFDEVAIAAAVLAKAPVADGDEGNDRISGRAGNDDRLRSGTTEFRLMAQINLLPWREERRQELKKQFLVTLGLVFTLGVGLVLLGDRVVNAQIELLQLPNAAPSQPRPESSQPDGQRNVLRSVARLEMDNIRAAWHWAVLRGKADEIRTLAGQVIRRRLVVYEIVDLCRFRRMRAIRPILSFAGSLYRLHDYVGALSP